MKAKLIIPIFLFIQSLTVSAETLQKTDTILNRPAEVKQNVEPQYPLKLANNGIKEGYATFLLTINEKGELIDYLPVEASKKLFIKAIENVLEKWEYIPCISNGNKVTSVAEITFNFSHTQQVGSGSAMGPIQELLNIAQPELKVYKLPELDQLPQPISVAKPILYPSVDPDASRTGSVVLKFYIDTEGKVRMPSLMKSDVDAALTASAYEALLQWTFTPPVKGGKPVIIATAQKFSFNDSAKE